jgi:LPS-assembly protein
LDLTPSNYFSLSTDSRYNFDRGRWDDYSGDLLLRDRRGNSLGLEYRRRKATAEEEEIDYAELNLKTSLLRPLYLGYRNRYDLIDSNQLEQVVDIEYRHQCWGVLVTLRERDDEKSFMLTFSLGGVGTVGRVGGTMGGS